MWQDKCCSTGSKRLLSPSHTLTTTVYSNDKSSINSSPPLSRLLHVHPNSSPSYSSLSLSLSQPTPIFKLRQTKRWVSLKPSLLIKIPHLCPHKNSNSTPILKNPFFSSPAFPFLSPHFVVKI